jgi:hypothetical protein
VPSANKRLALQRLLSVRGCAVRRLAQELGVAVRVDSASGARGYGGVITSR